MDSSHVNTIKRAFICDCAIKVQAPFLQWPDLVNFYLRRVSIKWPQLKTQSMLSQQRWKQKRPNWKERAKLTTKGN